MIQHILVAVDGSDGSKRAVGLARELATALQARVTLLHVIEPPASFPIEAYGLNRNQVYDVQLQGARALLAAIAAEMPGRVDQVVDSGSPAETICAQSEERDADLVLLGSRGMGTMGRWLLGSVSDRVVHLSKRPVTVVR
ncbi:universal stress protein [Vulgatibacter sp.]|uniref:universal stress protein n=1 Tax=Vulgatibacter sp. TaxID=1971226 RepID=UPI0035645990